MLAYQIVPIFYGVLFTDAAVNVVDQTLDLLSKKLATLEERYRTGLASDFDLSLIKVQMGGLQAQKLDFQNAVKKMFMAYNRIAGRPLESTFIPDGELKLEPVEADASALVREAAANRVEARQTENQRRLVQTQMALARTADKPNVVASFNYEFRNGFLPSVDRIRGNWNAVLAVSYPLFDGSRTAAQVAQAQVALRTVQEQAEDLERGFELEINQTLADLGTLEKKIVIEKTKIAHSERALQIADERYQNGLISTTDLVEAQDALDSARLNYLQLVYNHVLGRFSLFKAAGRKIYS
jgi:outer membrane protein